MRLNRKCFLGCDLRPLRFHLLIKLDQSINRHQSDPENWRLILDDDQLKHRISLRPFHVADDRKCLRLLTSLPINTTPTSSSSASLEVPSSSPCLVDFAPYLEILQICIPRNNGARSHRTIMPTRPRDAYVDDT
jgi:hypothetical protein